jgi:hypothetical protein
MRTSKLISSIKMALVIVKERYDMCFINENNPIAVVIVASCCKSSLFFDTK